MLLVCFKIVVSIQVGSDRCNVNGDCDTKLCDLELGVCKCKKVFDFSTKSVVEQEYQKGVCFSKIMAMCTLPLIHRQNLEEIKCIPNAKCKYAPFKMDFDRQLNGICKCNIGYFAAENNTICVPQEIFSSSQRATTMNELEDTEDEDQQLLTNNTRVSLTTAYPRNETKNHLKYVAHADITTNQLESIVPSKKIQQNYSNVPGRYAKLGLENGTTAKSTTVKSLIIIKDSREKEFGETCIEHDDCYTKYCEAEERTCSCNTLYDFVYETSMKQFFDTTSGKCQSLVNQLCTTHGKSVNESTQEWICVRGAMCFDDGRFGGGKCICKPRYLVNSNRTECFATSSSSISSSCDLHVICSVFIFFVNMF